MHKCGDRFCSNSNIKSETDVINCILDKIEDFPNWKGNCFFMRQSAGCPECGGRMIKGSSCSYCAECGWSKCG